MTHGCLEIYGLRDHRKLLLHTYHTGMDIPLAVELAIAVRAEYYAWQVESARTREATHGARLKPFDRKLLQEWCKSGIIDTGHFDYQPTAAAMIITAMPGMLAPTPPNFTKDLPTWGGQDSPYTLRISRDQWLLKDEEGETILEFNPVERLLDLLLLRPLMNKEI